MEMSKEGMQLRIKDLEKQVDDLIDEIHFNQVQINTQKDIINKLINKLMSKYPRRVWTCKKRDTTSVEMCDESVVIVRRRKGEKDDIYTAVAYAITKNLIGSKRFNDLVKKAKNYEPKDKQ